MPWTADRGEKFVLEPWMESFFVCSWTMIPGAIIVMTPDYTVYSASLLPAV